MLYEIDFDSLLTYLCLHVFRGDGRVGCTGRVANVRLNVLGNTFLYMKPLATYAQMPEILSKF